MEFCIAVFSNGIPLLLHYELWRRFSKRNKNVYPTKQSSLLNGWKVNLYVNGILIKEVFYLLDYFFSCNNIYYRVFVYLESEKI